MVMGSNLCLFGVNGVVHGRVFKSLYFGVNGGVVHGLGFESSTFGCQWWCSA
jgi:hypothetical protein